MGHRFLNGLPRLGRLPSLVFVVLLACVFSLIAIAVCIDRVTLDRFVDLMPMHGDISRGCNAEANFAVSDLNHHHADVVADHDFLIYGAR